MERSAEDTETGRVTMTERPPTKRAPPWEEAFPIPRAAISRPSAGAVEYRERALRRDRRRRLQLRERVRRHRPGGLFEHRLGSMSFAAGSRAKANHDGTFVWGDTTPVNVASTSINQFIVRASGGIWLGTTSTPSITIASDFLNTSTGAHLTIGGSLDECLGPGIEGELPDRRSAERSSPASPHYPSRPGTTRPKARRPAIWGRQRRTLRRLLESEVTTARSERSTPRASRSPRSRRCTRS